MSKTYNAKLLIPLLLPLLMVVGCGSSSGPELGSVYGRVTIDGSPLADAFVRFQPLQNGRPAIATTDSDGYYVLRYTNESDGAVLGQHIVRISTATPATDSEEGQTAAKLETVPVQYNRDASKNPKMQVEIKSGKNEFNFELESKGEIAQILH